MLADLAWAALAGVVGMVEECVEASVVVSEAVAALAAGVVVLVEASVAVAASVALLGVALMRLLLDPSHRTPSLTMPLLAQREARPYMFET
jgi:hypothetical protein